MFARTLSDLQSEDSAIVGGISTTLDEEWTSVPERYLSVLPQATFQN